MNQHSLQQPYFFFSHQRLFFLFFNLKRFSSVRFVSFCCRRGYHVTLLTAPLRSNIFRTGSFLFSLFGRPIPLNSSSFLFYIKRSLLFSYKRARGEKKRYRKTGLRRWLSDPVVYCVIQVGLAILIEMYENKFYRDVSSIDKRDVVEVQRNNQTGKSDKPSTHTKTRSANKKKLVTSYVLHSAGCRVQPCGTLFWLIQRQITNGGELWLAGEEERSCRRLLWNLSSYLQIKTLERNPNTRTKLGINPFITGDRSSRKRTGIS